MPPKPSNAPTHSKRFGEDYGDFVMQSSDNVLFHFPKGLLQYASPFFKDLLSIGMHAETVSSVENSQPLVMEEDSVTLDNLLCWIDPSHVGPTIDSAMIVQFLRAGHKYQVDSIVAWFAREAAAREESTCLVNAHRSFLSTDPLLALSLAEHYDLPGLARLALRRAILEPTDVVLAHDAQISGKMLLHLLHLRRKRTQWFLERIDRIDRSRRGPQGTMCTHCHSCLTTWTRKVNDAPSWASLENEIPSISQGCRYHHLVGPYPPTSSHTLSKDLESWERDARRLEQELPELPKRIFRSKNTTALLKTN